MADFTLIKANPTQGEITSSLTGSTGDGAGLHFENNGYVDLGNVAAAKFGTSDFSIEFVLNQTAENSIDNYIYFTNISGKNRAFFRNDISENLFRITFSNSSNSETSADIAYDMSADYGTPTHYVLTFDRDGDATLYKNGSSVGSVDISAFSAINLGDDTTQIQRFGSGTNYGVIGTFYRFRTWNKIVDAKALYERADVDFADQYGSQTSKILNGTSWTGASGTTPPTSWTVGTAGTFTIDSSSGSGSEPALKITRNSNNPYIYQTFSAVVGKQYRVKYRAKNVDATHVRVGIGSSAVGTQYNATDTTATSWQDFEQTYTATTTTFSVYVQLATTTGTQSGYIDSLVVEQVGAVVDMDLAAANPTQSLTVQDRSGAADGTCSASGVTQVQPVVQLNATAARIGTSAATPADGEVISGKLTVGASASTDTLAGFSDSQAAIVGGDNVGLALQSTNSNKSARVRFFDHSGNQDATVGFDNSNSNLFMGTGTSAHLSINSSGNITTTSDGIALKLDGSSNTTRGIFIRNTGGSAHGYLHTDGNIKLIAEDSGKSISFYTADDGTGTARLSIASTGTATLTNSNSGLVVKNSGASNKEWRVGGGSAGQFLITEVGVADVVSIAAGGLCAFANGIAFGGQTDATGSGIAVGGTMLDHYERGTFELTDASGAGLTIGSGYGKYTRIGDRVFITVNFDVPTTSNTQTFNVTGLPFPVHNDNDSRGLVLNYTDKSGIAYALTPKNTSNIFLHTASGGGVTNADASGGGFYINGHYVI